MVIAFKNLAKRTFAKITNNFKSICYMVSNLSYVLIFVVIESIVINTIRSLELSVLIFLCWYKVNFIIV